MIRIFQRLSDKIGSDRVVWRYDPIFFMDKYDRNYHLKAFVQIAEALCGYTERCVISFVDMYAKTRRSMQVLGVKLPDDRSLKAFAEEISAIAGRFRMEVTSCAEAIDLSSCVIGHGSCIDRELIERLTGSKLMDRITERKLA